MAPYLFPCRFVYLPHSSEPTYAFTSSDVHPRCPPRMKTETVLSDKRRLKAAH